MILTAFSVNSSQKLFGRYNHFQRSALFGLVVGLALLAYIASSGLPKPRGNADKAQIKKLLDQLMAADNAGGVDQIMSFYADDAITMPPNDNIVIGKEAIAARYKAGFAKFKMEVSLSSDELEICGDWAFNRGKTSGRLIWHDGSNPTPLNDKYLMILRRQAGKSWKIARLMWSHYPKN
ncbi:DUF4440 domain-containing protein [candidate division KSB1 bacterium]|nr:DUF4440 domain-containing protein [candidate division KSB1 bacterium]